MWKIANILRENVVKFTLEQNLHISKKKKKQCLLLSISSMRLKSLWKSYSAQGSEIEINCIYDIPKYMGMLHILSLPDK